MSVFLIIVSAKAEDLYWLVGKHIKWRESELIIILPQPMLGYFRSFKRCGIQFENLSFLFCSYDASILLVLFFFRDVNLCVIITLKFPLL
jgi:hypothetical protein